MRLITLIFLLIAPSFVAAEIRWPDTKYDVGMCLTPTNTEYYYYGKTAHVMDIFYSKNTREFKYDIIIVDFNPGHNQRLTLPVNMIDNNTAQVQPCPS